MSLYYTFYAQIIGNEIEQKRKLTTRVLVRGVVAYHRDENLCLVVTAKIQENSNLRLDFRATIEVLISEMKLL